jgi:hypothetical protein
MLVKIFIFPMHHNAPDVDENFIKMIFQICSESENVREANEIYDAIKEGSTRILGHLMRVPASSYFFALE